MTEPVVARAEEIAERVLFATSLETDAAPLVPRSHLDCLAEAGLFGLAGPAEMGGVDLPAFCSVIEALAGGCLSTTFVWIQHNTPVRELTSTPNEALRDEWLPPLCRGERRAGIALGGLQGGSAGLTAEVAPDGWLISGTAPYVSGWGLIDVLLAAAVTEEGNVVRCLIDARASESVSAQPLRLLATNASGTVRLHFRRHLVPRERVTSVAPYSPPPPYDGGGRPNGSLALGVARRCIAMIGETPLEAELQTRRRELDEATEQQLAPARAAASELAMRAAAGLVAWQGSRSIFLDAQAQRLYREAAFLLVFGSRPAIRRELLLRLGVDRTPS